MIVDPAPDFLKMKKEKKWLWKSQTVGECILELQIRKITG